MEKEGKKVIDFFIFSSFLRGTNQKQNFKAFLIKLLTQYTFLSFPNGSVLMFHEYLIFCRSNKNSWLIMISLTVADIL